MWFLHRLSIVSIWVKKFCNVHSILFQPYKYQNATNAQKRQYFLLKRVNTHYDQMKLLEIRDWKIEILLITAKTGFYSLVFHMLASYIGPKVPKDFCDIPTWQITRKLIVINSFFKDTSVILLNIISSIGTFSKLSTANSSYKFQNISKR